MTNKSNHIRRQRSTLSVDQGDEAMSQHCNIDQNNFPHSWVSPKHDTILDRLLQHCIDEYQYTQPFSFLKNALISKLRII